MSGNNYQNSPKICESSNRENRRQNLTLTKLAGLALGPTALIILLLLPLPLTWEQQCLLAVILMTVIYWVFQPIPIPVTSILALTLAILLDIASPNTVFGSFSSPTLFLLIGGFLITQSMLKYDLGKRVALGVLSIPGIGGSTKRIVIAFGLLAALLSSVIDNGAVASMLVPIAIALIRTLSDDMRSPDGKAPSERPLRFASALMLVTAYGATVGALLTPFGDAANMVGREFIYREFGTLMSVDAWMVISIPIVVILFVCLVSAVLFINRPEIAHLPDAKQQFLRSSRELGRMSRGEINTAIVFGLAVFLWFLPAPVALLGGHSSDFHIFLNERLQPSVVAILAACSLFVIPISRQQGFTLRWRDTRSMDWGPILLVGSALALGSLMNETGLAQVIGSGLATRIEGASALTISFIASAMAIMFSEISTNLVSITVLVPSIVPVAEAGGADPLAVALIATFSAIYGFMLPISTSANAIAYGSGQIPIWRMIKTGFIVDLSGILIIVLGATVMLRIASPF